MNQILKEINLINLELLKFISICFDNLVDIYILILFNIFEFISNIKKSSLGFICLKRLIRHSYYFIILGIFYYFEDFYEN